MKIVVVEDSPNTTTEEFNRRKTICEACPLYEDGCCSDCNCLIDRKALKLEDTCPEGRW